MRNKSVTKSGSGLNSWMDEFLVGMAKKFSKDESLTKTASEEEVVEGNTQEEEQEVLAEININDLEKVIWNDETFYVQFDSAGANVFNEFGNVVTTLKGVNSITDVDNALNGKQVVVSSTEEDLQVDAEFQDELAKAVSYLDEAEEVTAEEEVLAEEEMVTVADVTEDESLEFDEEDAADTAIENETYDIQASTTDEDPFVEALISGIDTLEQRLAQVEEQLTKVTQEYARSLDVQNLDNGAATEEQKHYEETAAATQEQINSDNAADLTTPQGRVELSQHQHEEAVVEETPATEEVTETPVVEETPEEVTEEPTEEVTEEETPATEEVTETPVTEEVTETPVTEETPTEEPVTEETTEETKEEEQIKALSSAESKIFKHAICPSCGEKSLTLNRVASNMQGVYCASCPSEYAVNMDTEEIFAFKG